METHPDRSTNPSIPLLNLNGLCDVIHLCKCFVKNPSLAYSLQRVNEISLVHVVLDYKCKLRVRINWEQVLNIIQSSFFSKEHLKINLPPKTIHQWLLNEFVK